MSEKPKVIVVDFVAKKRKDRGVEKEDKTQKSVEISEETRKKMQEIMQKIEDLQSSLVDILNGLNESSSLPPDVKNAMGIFLIAPLAWLNITRQELLKMLSSLKPQ